MSKSDLMTLSALEQATQLNVDQQEVCSRCRHTVVSRSSAPDGSGAWSIYACARCCFSCRSTEDVMYVLKITEGKTYRLSDSEIEKLPVPVTSV